MNMLAKRKYSLTMTSSKRYVRDGLLPETKTVLDNFLTPKDKAKTLSNTVTYTFTFKVDHLTALPRDKGAWTVVVHIDFASPRDEPDGHGGLPHAQFDSCLGQEVTKVNGDKYINTQNFKDEKDTHLLSDKEIVDVITSGTFPSTLLNWLAERLLTKEPFHTVNLPSELHFRGSNRAGS